MLDRESRLREVDFLRFEIEEIENAALNEGEEEELAALYRRCAHARRIAECLGTAYEAVEGEWLGTALKEVSQAVQYDDSLEGIGMSSAMQSSILSNAQEGDGFSYLDSMDIDEETFRRAEARLDLIRGLQAKYGSSIGAIRKKLEEKKKRLEELEDYDIHRQRLEKRKKADPG